MVQVVRIPGNRQKTGPDGEEAMTKRPVAPEHCCWKNLAYPERRCPNPARWQTSPEVIAAFPVGKSSLAACKWCDLHKLSTDVPIPVEDVEDSA